MYVHVPIAASPPNYLWNQEYTLAEMENTSLENYPTIVYSWKFHDIDKIAFYAVASSNSLLKILMGCKSTM